MVWTLPSRRYRKGWRAKRFTMDELTRIARRLRVLRVMGCPYPPHSDCFIVKGAALLLVWFGEAVCPTKDVDLQTQPRPHLRRPETR